MSWPWVSREWHAWRGHQLFLGKRFAEASFHLVHARPGQTLYAAALKLPPMQRLYAQSLLGAGRAADAVRHYTELADLDPGDATLALIIALHDGTRGNWESAAARLEAHRTSTLCRRCKDAHSAFRSAAMAQADIAAAQHAREARLVSMKLPAQCILYRGGRVAAGVLSAHVLSFLGTGMDGLFQAGGTNDQAIERVIDAARPLMRKTLGEILKEAVRLAPQLETSCARTVQIHEILRLKEIPLVRDIDAWVAFQTLEALVGGQLYIREAKDALAAAPHLYELGVHAVAYARAYTAESHARGVVSEADTYARSQWDAIKVAAQEPEFASKGVALLREGVALVPSERSWVETIKSYVWPF